MKEWLPAGTIIAHFRISSRISANGIGEVYLAKELSSGLEVALKLLPASLISDERIRQRFVQTFSIVAQLRHPSFCRTYEGGVAEDGRPFVAMEYVKGQSFDLIGFGPQLPVPQIVSLVIQIAEALDGAHARGWFHLAIKPSNLMLAPDGRAKILDFGIGVVFPLSLSDAGDESLKATAGAARYLSPEQVSGSKLDQRSDIFSLGAVFYELLTGHPPFAGSSVDEVIAGVTLATPPPVTSYREDAPSGLNPIVAKALAKDANARYRTMGELARDLRNLAAQEQGWMALMPPDTTRPVHASGREGKPGSVAAEARGEGKSGKVIGAKLASASFIDDLKRLLTSLFESKSKRRGGGEGQVELIRERSFLEDIVHFFKLYWQILLASFLALVGIAIAVTIIGMLWNREPKVEDVRSMQIEHLTTNGKVTSAAISPGGDRLVYAIDESEGQSLWLKELKSAKETRLASASSTEYRGLAFSPDGQWVSYFKSRPGDGPGAVYRMAARGGAEQQLPVKNATSAVSFSPDGRSLAAIIANDIASETSLWVGAATGAGKFVVTRQSPAAFHPSAPAWSPDGRFIACAVKDADNDLYLKVMTIAVADKTENTVVSGRWSEIDGIAWLNDGGGLIVAASDPIARASKLWRVDYPSGAISRVTADTVEYRGASLAGDARLLVSVQQEALSNLWIAPEADPGQLRQITTGRFDGVNGIAWTPDRRLVFASWTNDRENIWVSGQGKNNEIPPSHPIPTESGDGGQYHPAVSPDGRFVAYVIERAGGAYLLRNEIERREMKLASEERLAFFPQFSSDGRWIVYSAIRNGRGAVAKVSSDGGKPETVIDRRAWRAVPSPDGTKIACNYLDETTARWRLAVFPVSGGNPLAVFDAPGSMHRVVQWTPDGNGLAFIVTRGGVSNIWVQPVSGGAPSPVTSFKTDRIFNFAWSRDGRQLALARGWSSGDVVLIRNFR
jgi:serine/threonine protein kinase/Tol biopolymer transport system component